ncbi:MAG: dihydroneopterin aldolase [Firmicutes bacterium]|nr:dihydroneopterin aldolase [Bacillota bacterium]
MSLKVRLQNMVFYAYHGVFPAEKELGQRFEVDVEYLPKKEASGCDDDIAKAVNYAEVYQVIKGIVTEKRYNLMETLAGAIADGLLASFPLCRVTVRVRKPAAPLGAPLDYVEIEVSKEAGE